MDKKGKKCYACNKYGHITKDCYSKNKKEGQREGLRKDDPDKQNLKALEEDMEEDPFLVEAEGLAQMWKDPL